MVTDVMRIILKVQQALKLGKIPVTYYVTEERRHVTLD